MKKNPFRTIFTLLSCLLVSSAFSQGSLDPTNAPAPSMHSLDEIYQKVDHLWAGVIYTNATAAVPKTGQTVSYATGDDGDLEAGVEWPNPRFDDNSDGTVKDNLTGLIWLKNANAFDVQVWTNALAACNALNSGEHGLTDGSVEGDWRLPNAQELHSLVDYGHSFPPLPSGHPFTGVQPDSYWSGTYYFETPGNAWFVRMSDGTVYAYPLTNLYYVWPVRGGQ